MSLKKGFTSTSERNFWTKLTVYEGDETTLQNGLREIGKSATCPPWRSFPSPSPALRYRPHSHGDGFANSSTDLSYCENGHPYEGLLVWPSREGEGDVHGKQHIIYLRRVSSY